MSGFRELLPDTKRQARNSFRGYAYQAYQTICGWLKCRAGEEILTEFAEDLDLVRRDLDGNVTDVELNQIKHKKGAVTLNSKDSVDLINNFFCHKKRNPDIRIFIHLCTISDRGKEKNGNWKHADCGMDLWDRLRGRGLNEDEQQNAVHLLRSFLLSNNEFSEDTKTFIRECDELTFLNSFIDRIFWDTGQQSYSEIENEIKHLLAKLPRSITEPEEVRQVIDRLWRHVTDIIAAESSRILTQKDLEKILTQETSIVVDRRTIKEMQSEIGEIRKSTSLIENRMGTLLGSLIPTENNVEFKYPEKLFDKELPPLPKICCSRTAVIEAIKDKYAHHLLTWIHGSTGYGKTILANLLIRGQSRPCYWFGLRDITEFNLISSLQRVLSFSKSLEENEVVIVFDDLNVDNQHTYCVELIHTISQSLFENKSKLLITSQLEPSVRLKALLDRDIFIFDAPEMAISEISELIKMAGITDNKENEFWSNYIYGATSGHPQLVSAYFYYLRDTGWSFSSIDEFINKFLAKPRPVEQVKAESRKLLAQTITSEEARELARRLSVIVGTFEREFAIDLALSHPSLKEPGTAFDALIGPWVEEAGNNLFSLSPLLTGYAEAEFGPANVKKYYGIASYAWLKKKSLTPLQIIQAMMAGFTAKVEPLIAKICHFVTSIDPEKMGPIAKELSILTLFNIEKCNELDDMDPIVRFMFRHLQLKISEYIADWSSYSRIDGLISNELNEFKSHPFYKELYVVHCVDTSIRIESPLKAKERIDRVICALGIAFEEGSQRTAFIYDKTSLCQVMLVATQNITSLDDLEYLFDRLEEEPAEIVESIMAGFATYPESWSLLIDRVWLAESKQQPSDWLTCEKVFVKAMNFGKKQANQWLMAAAARGRMVVFDEYKDDPLMALTVAREARSAIGSGHPLIDLQESTVIFREGQYSRVLDMIIDLEDYLPGDVLTLSRVFGLSRALHSAAKLEAWEEAKKCILFGKKLSDSIEDSLLSEAIRVAFKAEMGLLAHFTGDISEGARLFTQVLVDIEKFPDQQYQRTKVLHRKFVHTVTWSSDVLINGFFLSENESKSHLLQPTLGWFSNFEDLPLEIMEKPTPPYSHTWSMLTTYAAWGGQRDITEICAQRALEETNQGQYYLAVLKTWEALFISHLTAKEFNLAFHSGLQFVRLLLGLKCQNSNEWDPLKPMDLKAKLGDLEPMLAQNLIEHLINLVLEPIFMAICTLDELPAIDFQGWNNFIDGILGPRNDFASILSWLETGILAIFEDEAAMDKIKEDMSDKSRLPERLRRLAMLFRCASKGLHHHDNLSAQSTMLLQNITPFRCNIWMVAFCRMVAKRWRYLAVHQRFLIACPGLSAPRILDLASLPNPKVSDCANLLLIVAEGIPVRWSHELYTDLRKVGKAE